MAQPAACASPSLHRQRRLAPAGRRTRTAAKKDAVSSKKDHATAGSAAKTSPAVHAWLVAYNVASLVGWAYVLAILVRSLVASNGNTEISYATCGLVLTIVQAGAVLEVAHALTGAVKSPVFTTAMQVASRLLLVALCLGINDPAVRSHPAFSSMVFAWSITEVIRYAYYGLNLIGLQSQLLVWARYTFFFVLYPIGAGSELWLVIRAINVVRQTNTPLFVTLCVVALTYPPGFYIMYTHMIRQRRKYLGGMSKDKKN